MSIGFYDSGNGGISVLNEALKLMPDEDYIYYADCDNVPYGTKPREQVKRFAMNAGDFMNQHNVKALVVACNTATSIAIDDMRKKFSFPVIGMEPAVKPAVEHTHGNKRVLVTATPLTIKQNKLRNLIERLDGEDIIDLVPLPRLVEFAEKLAFDEKEVLPYLEEELKGYNAEAYSTVVMGCTHFSFYKDMYQKLYPNCDVIDGSLGTVKNLRRILAEAGNRGGGTGKIEFFNSGRRAENTEKFKALFNRLADIEKHNGLR